MSTWNALLTVSLTCLLLTACEGPPECPAGTTKRGSSCVARDAVGAEDASSGLTDGAAGDADASECAAGTQVYADDDGDGYGAGRAIEGCPVPALVERDGDCQPDEPAAHPGASELCNGIDDDCDGDLDEGTVTTLYADADGDGHGDVDDPGEKVCADEAREGKVGSHDDCDDSCTHCTPGDASELMCDGLDDNCNGEIDEGLVTTFKLDCDGDGYLSAAHEAKDACAAPDLPGSCPKGAWLADAPAALDCDDANEKRSPAGTETCDGIDNDCDGSSDDGLATKTYYPDCDEDKYPRASSAQTRCGSAALVAPICAHYIVARSDSKVDCADNDARARPGAAAVADSSGIMGTHVTGNRQDFDCSGAVTMSPTLSTCPSGGGCSAQGACRLETLACGREGKIKSKTVVTGPMGVPLELCTDETVTPTCR